MLRRVALALFLLMVTGVAAMFAAGQIRLPWSLDDADRNVVAKGTDTPAATDAAKSAIDDAATALAPAPDAPATGKVEIDISRISPEGTSVFAGRAEPDSYVTVIEEGKPAGTAKTDSNGEWTLSTEHKFASVDPKLSYEVSRTPPPAPVAPEQKVAKASPASPSPSAVAGEVMRKFENLVEEARKEAKQQTETAKAAEAPAESARPAESAKQAGPAETVTAVEPDVPAQKSDGVASAEPQVKADQGKNASATSSASGSESAGTSSQSATSVTVAPSVSDKGPTAGVQTDAIPVPLMFSYNQATLTPEGERAAALLLEYLTLKHLSSVELTGHADERGTDQYNYELSDERLQTVSHLLKEGGYKGELKLTPKGKTEPYSGVDRSTYSREALYQLDRRVELRVTR